MTEQIDNWNEVVMAFHEALPEIDEMLSEANVPMSGRPGKAFKILLETIVEISDYKSFFLSEFHGRFRIIVSDWYQRRYGDVASSNKESDLEGVVLIHGTPFLMRVPQNFKTQANEPNMIWVGFPASVQVEENSLLWIEEKGVVKNLSEHEKKDVQAAADRIANLIRSIGFDLRSLEYDNNKDISDLAGTIGSDLKASARHLCAQSAAGLRSAGWDASQATEKSLKLFIRRKGQTPPHSHDLQKLADQAERLGVAVIDRVKLGLIPSSRQATSMRYGGDAKLADAIEAYEAALVIIRDLLFQAKPDTPYNVREARFKLKLPPWFEFDTEAFRGRLQTIVQQSLGDDQT